LNLEYGDKINKKQLKDLNSIKLVHEAIITAEKTCGKINLKIVYDRGLMYILAYEFADMSMTIEEFFYNNFHVCYTTVRRYKLFTEFINVYPRMLVVGLSFSQIIKHHSRLLDWFERDKEISSRLRNFVTIKIQNKPFDLEPVEENGLPLKPEMKISVDPDFVYETDDWYDPVDLDDSELMGSDQLEPPPLIDLDGEDATAELSTGISKLSSK
jgi:hypothetical protein